VTAGRNRGHAYDNDMLLESVADVVSRVFLRVHWVAVRPQALRARRINTGAGEDNGIAHNQN
jgi:hypothetical protein